MEAVAGYRETPDIITQFATFYVGNLLFGLDVMQVQEIIRYQEMTLVPLSSPIVEGLINLRGQIITAIDMRKRLQIPAIDKEKLPMNVVVRHNEEIVSLLVDRIGDVLEVQPDQFENTPDTLKGSARDVVQGVYKLKKQLLLELNIDKAMEETGSGESLMDVG